MVNWPDAITRSFYTPNKPEPDAILALRSCPAPDWILHVGAFAGQTTSVMATMFNCKILASEHRWNDHKILSSFFHNCWNTRSKIDLFEEYEKAIEKAQTLGPKGLVFANGQALVDYPDLMETLIKISSHIVGTRIEDYRVNRIVGDAVSGKVLSLQTWETAWKVYPTKRTCIVHMEKDALTFGSLDIVKTKFENSGKEFAACRKPNGEFDLGVVLYYSKCPSSVKEHEVMELDRIYNYMPWVWPCKYQNGMFITDDNRKIVVLRTKAGTIKDCPKGLLSKP